VTVDDTSTAGGLAILAGLALAGLSAAWLEWAARSGRLDRAVKRRIAAGARSLAGLAVDFDVVALSPFSGRLVLSGLVVANPAGYARPHALTCPEIRVSVDPLSLLAGPLVFRSIRLLGPELSFEAGSGTNNLADLRAGIVQAGTAGDGRAGRKIVIDRFETVDARIRLGLTALGPVSVAVPFPDLRLDGVGRAEGGLTPPRALAGLVGAAVERAVDVAGAHVEDKARQSARRLGERLKNLITR
jgi:hypothetical protein